jgi:hypothetical protein
LTKALTEGLGDAGVDRVAYDLITDHTVS